MTDRIWTRDLDGTGSQHVCLKDDPGAQEWARVEDLVAERRLYAEFRAAALDFGKAFAVWRNAERALDDCVNDGGTGVGEGKWADQCFGRLKESHIRFRKALGETE